MNNQTLVIYDFKILFEILTELESHINFSLLNVKKLTDLNFKTLENYIVISVKKQNIENQILIDKFPIHINKLVELINIKFLKKKYNQQSQIDIGTYKLNLNSRKIFNKKNSINLTEREANIIIFLYNSKKPVKISKLQTEVWGHNSKLETHTVETHIYRLRKKINNIFSDENFIKSSKAGYIIQ
tara:strand:+ start:107 stop:661 length:555 start_codon:yes stop_codon:yes gene_type:complete